MRPLITPAGRRLLEQVVRSRACVVLDFDGTLAPIVSDPARAQMRARTRSLLKRVADRYPSAVLSGRARDDVERRIEGTGIAWIVGSHGADWGWTAPDTAQVLAQVQAWRCALEGRLQACRGVVVEDKKYSLAVHYRHSREKKKAQAAIAEAVTGLQGARLCLGKMVVNLVPEGAPHKGIALKRLRTLLAADVAIYVGDDVTDEDVFALDEPGQLLSVRVGPSRDSRAAYYLEDQRQMDELLRLLADLRDPRRAISAA